MVQSTYSPDQRDEKEEGVRASAFQGPLSGRGGLIRSRTTRLNLLLLGRVYRVPLFCFMARRAKVEDFTGLFFSLFSLPSGGSFISLIDYCTVCSSN
jgi:hypothetical protein